MLQRHQNLCTWNQIVVDALEWKFLIQSTVEVQFSNTSVAKYHQLLSSSWESSNRNVFCFAIYLVLFLKLSFFGYLRIQSKAAKTKLPTMCSFATFSKRNLVNPFSFFHATFFYVIGQHFWVYSLIIKLGTMIKAKYWLKGWMTCGKQEHKTFEANWRCGRASK